MEEHTGTAALYWLAPSHGRVKRRRNFRFKLEAPHFFHISHEIEFQTLTDILSFLKAVKANFALLSSWALNSRGLLLWVRNFCEFQLLEVWLHILNL